MIHTINYLLTKLFDLLLYPFRFLGDFWGIFFLSALSSWMVLIIYKYCSSPDKIVETKNQIKSNILAIRLYKDFIGVMLKSFGKSMLYTLKYFSLNLLPLILLIPLMFPMLVQMDVRYGMRPFNEGEEILVRAAFQKSLDDLTIQLKTNELLSPTMSPVFIDSFRDKENTKPIREVNWNLKAEKAGVTQLQIKINGNEFAKQLVVGKSPHTLSNKKMNHSSWGHFIYPSESLFENSDSLTSVSVRYPPKSVNFLGLKTHWLVHYLILVLVMVLAFRKRFGVEF